MKCLNNFEILSTFDSAKYLNKTKLVQIKTFLNVRFNEFCNCTP